MNLAAIAQLRKLIPRLASNHAGEVAATAAAIGRVLKSHGADFHDLASALCAPAPGEPAELGNDWRATLRFCAHHSARLDERELAFVARLGILARQPDEQTSGVARRHRCALTGRKMNFSGEDIPFGDDGSFGDDSEPVPEISVEAYDKIDRWREELDRTPKLDKRNVFERAADLFLEADFERDLAACHAIRDAVYELGRDHAGLDDDDISFIMVGAQTKAERPTNGGHSAPGDRSHADDDPGPNGPEDYAGGPQAKGAGAQIDWPPLTIEEWLARDLPEPDFILGGWLTTTTRALLVGPTGLGKTNFALALALAVAAGKPFLHWRERRPCRVLYIDGEMARRLLRQRIADAITRLGERPAGFYALSHEDIEKFAPLNTPAGQALIEQFIAEFKPDFIVFDSIMCLLLGDMKEAEPWAAVMPWIRSLTRRRIGQLWLHHTGHDEKRSYGDKTKEWQLDTVMHMEAIEREDKPKREETGVSRSRSQPKSRRRARADRRRRNRVRQVDGSDLEHCVTDRSNRCHRSNKRRRIRRLCPPSSSLDPILDPSTASSSPPGAIACGIADDTPREADAGGKIERRAPPAFASHDFFKNPDPEF